MIQVKTSQQIPRLLLSFFLGVLIALIYTIFEFLVNEGTNWLWNDLLQTDVYRWRVIPIAVILSIVYSVTIKIFKQKRLLPLEGNDFSEEIRDLKTTTIKNIFAVFVIGVVSLLAGASLGPEASLIAISLGLAAYLAGRRNLLKSAYSKILSLSAFSALLTAFFFSFIPLTIPLLILFKKKKLTINSALIPILTSLGSWITIYFLKGSAYGSVPVSGTFTLQNILVASVLGFFAVFIGFGVKHIIKKLSVYTVSIDKKVPWYMSAIIFGAVLGILYYIGGQSVQFDGSYGVHILEDNKTTLSALALLGLVLIKMLTTSWSLTSGYRGGLVFPSIYIGMALSFAVGGFLSMSDITEVGATVGAISGIFVVMINPVVGSILLFTLFPIELFPVIIGGILGAVIALQLPRILKPDPERK